LKTFLPFGKGGFYISPLGKAGLGINLRPGLNDIFSARVTFGRALRSRFFCFSGLMPEKQKMACFSFPPNEEGSSKLLSPSHREGFS